MDYRERKYYSIRLYNYNQEIEGLREVVPSLKVHEPYDHVKHKMRIGRNRFSDGTFLNNYVQVMVSCKINESNALERYMDKAKILNPGFVLCISLTKELLGQ